jgi:hypothetical protein
MIFGVAAGVAFVSIALVLLIRPRADLSGPISANTEAV